MTSAAKISPYHKLNKWPAQLRTEHRCDSACVEARFSLLTGPRFSALRRSIEERILFKPRPHKQVNATSRGPCRRGWGLKRKATKRRSLRNLFRGAGSVGHLRCSLASGNAHDTTSSNRPWSPFPLRNLERSPSCRRPPPRRPQATTCPPPKKEERA